MPDRDKNSISMTRIGRPFLIFLLATPIAQAEESFTFSSGIDFSRGKYGANSKTETVSIPFSAKFETDHWTLRASVPYVESTGPSNVSGSGSDRISLDKEQGTRQKTSGMGDVVVSASRSVFASGNWLIEIGGKMKIATADERQGLGTGKNDYAIQSEVYKTLDKHTLFSTVGYKKMGDPDDLDLKDPWYSSLGWSYRASQPTALGLSYDYRQKITDRGAPLREATGFVTHKLDPHWKIQAYVVTGFSKSSPDLGAGMVLFYTP